MTPADVAAKLVPVGEITVRGLAEPVTVFSIPSEGEGVTG